MKVVILHPSVFGAKFKFQNLTGVSHQYIRYDALCLFWDVCVGGERPDIIFDTIISRFEFVCLERGSTN